MNSNVTGTGMMLTPSLPDFQNLLAPLLGWTQVGHIGRGGKTTKVPDFRAAITVTTLTMNENAFSLPKTVDFTPRTEPLKFCRFHPILAIFSESVK